jgi:cytochrome c oxidase assembly factor CtaG
MGKTSIFTVITAVVVQFIVGYLWYGPHLFGDVVTTGSGHAIDFLKLDGISLLLVLLSGYGLTHVLGMINKLTGTKDMSGGLKTGLTVGAFAIGFPVVMLLNIIGFGKVALLVIFMYLVLITIVTNMVVIKLKHS